MKGGHWGRKKKENEGGRLRKKERRKENEGGDAEKEWTKKEKGSRKSGRGYVGDGEKKEKKKKKKEKEEKYTWVEEK